MNYTNLVLLAYGNEVEYRRAAFCILSFWASVSESIFANSRIIIYTDDPKFLDSLIGDLEIEYFLLTPEMLSEMLGKNDYIHRRKIEVIDRTFQKYPENRLVFVDSDTFFISDSEFLISELKQGFSLMHLRESTFKQALDLFTSFGQGREPAAFITYLESRTFFIGEEEVKFDRNDYCWNSGVLGLTKDSAFYIEDVFNLTDQFYSNSSWFISEQLAFSLVLKQTTTILPADKYVLHYWGKRQKTLMDSILERYFECRTVTDRSKADIEKKVKTLKKQLKDDMLKEQAALALYTKNWYYGIKKTVQALLRNPLNVSLFRELNNMRSKNN